MRKPILAGNWKMNKTIAEAVEFAEAVAGPLSSGYENVEMAVCVPFVQLPALKDILAGSPVKIGAQNMYWEASGAYTGEISPMMLEDLVDFVIIGHSERRAYFGETDETVNKKIHAALAHDLTPIVCIGETLEQNEAGETEAVVERQAKAAFDGISAAQARDIIIAYEPIWAIGTGKAATPDDANRICGQVVRATVARLYDDATAEAVRIQYGGSMKPSNVEELMKQTDIDGGLVGGASLEPESFINLIEVTSRIYG